MGLTLDLGRRIELLPIDSHFGDISIALYEQDGEGGSEFLVHTYSSKDNAAVRIDFVAEAMTVLGGMERTESEHTLRFPCGSGHFKACKRVFLEACKLVTGGTLEPRPLTIFDKKADRDVTVVATGDGRYQVTAEGDDDDNSRRVSAISGGLVKLGEMTLESEADNIVAFDCACDHHALAGLLLVRAPNVRAAMREQDQSGGGVLAAPSQQR